MVIVIFVEVVIISGLLFFSLYRVTEYQVLEMVISSDPADRFTMHHVGSPCIDTSPNCLWFYTQVGMTWSKRVVKRCAQCHTGLVLCMGFRLLG